MLNEKSAYIQGLFLEQPDSLVVSEGCGAVRARYEAALRAGTPPVIARIHGNAILIDLRTVSPEDDEVLGERLNDVLLRTRT